MKENTLNRRGKIRIILYVAFVISALGIFGIIQTIKASNLQKMCDSANRMALTSLDEYMTSLSADLKKIEYVNTPTMMTQLSTELWREATGAKNSLAMLPTGEKALTETYKFLSQVGEFVMSIQRKTMQGQEITQEERNKIKELSVFCEKLNSSVKEACLKMNTDSLNFTPKSKVLLNNQDSSVLFSKSMDDTEQAISDFPSLIYDGPFSDHLENTEPLYLKDKKEITKNEGLETAKRICKTDDKIKFIREEAGNIPAYIYECEHYTIAVAKKGGHPFYMLGSSYAGEIQLTYEKACDIAKNFLKSIGYDNMKESYYFTDDGIVTVNFAYEKNDTIYYSDLIKVSVNMENGEIVSFDASGYIYNHRERKITNNLISLNEAQNKINGNLEILDVKKTVIPTKWKTERFCYEFHCKAKDGQEMLVYIDAKTGDEANILLLLYSDGGVLTK